MLICDIIIISILKFVEKLISVKLRVYLNYNYNGTSSYLLILKFIFGGFHNMKKKITAIVAVFAIITLMFVAYGCGKSNSELEMPIVTSVSALETPEADFNFEELYDDNNYSFAIFHETTTDSLFILYYNRGSFAQILDPDTGLPLTYTLWQEKYAS